MIPIFCVHFCGARVCSDSVFVYFVDCGLPEPRLVWCGVRAAAVRVLPQAGVAAGAVHAARGPDGPRLGPGPGLQGKGSQGGRGGEGDVPLFLPPTPAPPPDIWLTGGDGTERGSQPPLPPPTLSSLYKPAQGLSRADRSMPMLGKCDVWAQHVLLYISTVFHIFKVPNQPPISWFFFACILGTMQAPFVLWCFLGGWAGSPRVFDCGVFFWNMSDWFLIPGGGPKKTRKK